MAILIVLNLITSLNIEAFSPIKPFLLTSYLDSWLYLFAFEIDTKKLISDALILVLHIVLFYVATILYYRRKDILS
jgi:hypothetical protein